MRTMTFLFCPPGTLAPCRPIRKNLGANGEIKLKILSRQQTDVSHPLDGSPAPLPGRSVSLTSFKTAVASNSRKIKESPLPFINIRTRREPVSLFTVIIAISIFKMRYSSCGGQLPTAVFVCFFLSSKFSSFRGRCRGYEQGVGEMLQLCNS